MRFPSSGGGGPRPSSPRLSAEIVGRMVSAFPSDRKREMNDRPIFRLDFAIGTAPGGPAQPGGGGTTGFAHGTFPRAPVPARSAGDFPD